MELPDIPGYRIVKEIGAGGMATVYLAIQESLHREVALKVMTPGLSVDETSCHRFLKEGRIAAQLSQKNLLTVYDIGVHENQYYMASEYLSGGTVRDRMPQLAEDEIVRIVAEIAEGLSYAHDKGFVHRDVKPGNMLFRANGDCVLGDFGIAKSVDSTTGATKIGTSIGTPHYMSPEQAKGEKVDHRTDLYSLGVVFYELLVGEPPFDADDPFSVALMQINEPVPPLPKKYRRYQPLIEKLMDKDRSKRYETGAAFVADLEQVIGQDAITRRPTARSAEAVGDNEEQPTPIRGPAFATAARSRGRMLRWLVPILVLGVLAGAGWWYRDAWWPDDLFTRQSSADDGTDDVEDAAATKARSVNTLLEQASALTAAGDFLPPAEPNAYDTYQQVLRLDAASTDARRGLRTLVAAIEKRAEALWKEGDTAASQALIDEGLRRFAGDPGLRYLQARIEQSAAGDSSTDTPERASGDVQTLLTRAGRFYERHDLVEAALLYRQVLERDPGNALAERQLIQIAENWAAVAETMLQRDRLDHAEGMINKGLEARPGYPRLLALKERVEELKAQQ